MTYSGRPTAVATAHRPDTSDPARLWVASLVATSAVILLLLCHSLWRTPYGISETVALLEDVDQNSPWHFFNLQSVYVRPLFYLTLSAIWHTASSVEAALDLFTVLHIASVAALVVLFFAYLRPRTRLDAAAAVIAAAVLMGSAAFRENLENLPLNQMMVVMVLTMVVWIIVGRPARSWHDPAIVVLTVLAIGFKEQGLLIAPIVVTAALMGAPGVSRRGALAIVVLSAGYAMLRLWYAPSWSQFPQEVGFGTGMLRPAEAAARFGVAPLGIYLYNVASGIASLLFAEPTAGVFRVVPHLLEGRWAAWEINNVASSSALTAVTVWWARHAIRRDAEGAWPGEARLAVVTLVAIVGSALLGFAYTRDRMSGVALIFYALAAFCAMRQAAERASRTTGAPLLAAGTVLMLLAASWQVRAIGTLEYSRQTAWQHQREWIIGLQRRRVDFANRPAYLSTLEAMIEQGTTPAATSDPAYPPWFVNWVGQR
jgi:hypothetical protein